LVEKLNCCNIIFYSQSSYFRNENFYILIVSNSVSNLSYYSTYSKLHSIFCKLAVISYFGPINLGKENRTRCLYFINSKMIINVYSCLHILTIYKVFTYLKNRYSQLFIPFILICYSTQGYIRSTKCELSKVRNLYCSSHTHLSFYIKTFILK